jgi:hypothetical protein
MANDRQNAIAHGAVNVQALIETIPGLKRLLSDEHIHQIQNILDAAVLNPELRKQGDDIYQRSVTLQIGTQVNRDAAMVAKAQRFYDKMIKVSEADHHIRLDFNKMLSADALMPRTDNPDEAEYLLKVRNTLATRGVWLRIGQPFVRSNEDPSQHLLDPKQWQLWFSLGYDGDTIPTKDGTIDRDELLSTTMLGAGYYRSVHTGHIQSKLKRKVSQLDAEIDDGISEHRRLIARKRDAFFGVAEVSDFLGGANLPGISIWDHPQNLMVKALSSNVGGDVMAAQVFLMVAARAVQYNAELLADYAERSSNGAARAIGILKVAKTAGEIADVVLVMTGVGAGIRIIRGGSKIAQEVAMDEAAKKFVSNYAKKNGISEAELAMTRYVRQPKGTILGYTKGGHSGGMGTGFHKW